MMLGSTTQQEIGIVEKEDTFNLDSIRYITMATGEIFIRQGGNNKVQRTSCWYVCYVYHPSFTFSSPLSLCCFTRGCVVLVIMLWGVVALLVFSFVSSCLLAQFIPPPVCMFNELQADGNYTLCEYMSPDTSWCGMPLSLVLFPLPSTLLPVHSMLFSTTIHLHSLYITPLSHSPSYAHQLYRNKCSTNIYGRHIFSM